MLRIKYCFLRVLQRMLPAIMLVALFITPCAAYADSSLIDAFNLAPFVPLILNSMMTVAIGGYNFFVGSHGDGIIYILIWTFLAISLSLYSVKMFLPKMWVSLFGFSGGGEMADGKVKGMNVAMDVLKPGFRAIIAATILLQIKPTYITQILINPFLEFGAIYTDGIINTINDQGRITPTVTCSETINANIINSDSGWLSERSCNFLVQPVDIISQKNNEVIKMGLRDFLGNGLRGLLFGGVIPHGGNAFMNIITGLVLIITFVSCNMMMALLMIQGIFDFCMSLILYPFHVLMWVAKPKNPDKWFDIWPAFSGITTALQKLVIIMIACAFILCVNIAIVKALFSWTNVTYVTAAGGTSISNVPTVNAHTTGFGEHSVLWLTAILTFFLMQRIFEMTREQLNRYTSGSDDMYKKVTSDIKVSWGKVKKAPATTKKILGTTKKIWGKLTK